MTSTEHLEDRVRRVLDARAQQLDAGVPVWQPSDAPFPALYDVGRGARRPSWGGLRLGGVVVAVSSGLAIAILIGAIVLLGHGHRAPERVVGAASDRALITEYGIFRRPQAATDRLPAGVRLPEPIGAGIVGHLTRLVTTIHPTGAASSAVRIYVVVYVRPVGHAPLGAAIQRGDRILTVAVPVASPARATFGTTVAAPDLGVTAGGSGHHALVGPGELREEDHILISVVPDGVARVRWVFSRAPGGRESLRYQTDYPGVENNVAASERLGSYWYLSSATWYDARGGAIASFRNTTQAHALAASAREPIAPVLVAHFALFRTPVPPPAVATPLPIGLLVGIDPNPHGLNLAQARYVPLATGQARGRPRSGVWVIPGHGGVAMMGAGGGITVGCSLSWRCSPPSGRFQLVTGPRNRTVIGLAPDGDRTVSVVLADNSLMSVPVIDNVYSVTLPPRAKAVMVRNAAGRTVTLAP
jgi:hypothetical protein